MFFFLKKLVLILLISNFFSYSFYRSLFFQFSSSIVISHMFCFLFRSFFFPDTFVEVFLSFNFIIQLNFLFCSFDLFFLLLKLFFNSI
jgi:hypothetical protein